jgi:hypothetical protein
LVGERGAGKTWLLRHLATHGSGTSLPVVYLDLEARAGFQKPEDFCGAVQDQVRRQCGNASPILLLDSVPVHLDEHLRAFEDAILKSHLTQRGSLLIMAPIHPSRAPWRTPSLLGGENCWVLPFEQPQTRAQLRRLDSLGMVSHELAPSYVQDYSGGLPLLNYLLVRWERRHAFELMLAYCFSRIPADDHIRVRSYLEATCVLEVLEHAPIQRVFKVYRRHRPHARAYPTQAGVVRNLLQKHWLAHPARAAPGRIALVESVRRAAREVLKAQDAELYAALNEVAAPSRKGGA